MFDIESETSLLISCGNLSSLSIKKGGVLGSNAAPEYQKIAA